MSTFDPPLPRHHGAVNGPAELVMYDTRDMALVIAVTINRKTREYDIKVQSKINKRRAARILRDIIAELEQP
ncbi:hypothetical protein [Rhodococcus ruber]|uniref:hypothetical protein n=1 Tax=Rhodococcus ruber TaxID=1830 RepID=UPI003D813F2D